MTTISWWTQVLECSWDELLHKVKDAEDLDQIIAAHQEFLDTITTRSLLDPQSKVSLAYVHKTLNLYSAIVLLILIVP